MLFAEDDPRVHDVVTRVLRKAVYDARDGRQAWAIFQRAQPLIDLVVADVVMPRMTATELAGHVVARQARELPIILMSAYAPEDLARRGLSFRTGTCS